MTSEAVYRRMAGAQRVLDVIPEGTGARQNMSNIQSRALMSAMTPGYVTALSDDERLALAEAVMQIPFHVEDSNALLAHIRGNASTQNNNANRRRAQKASHMFEYATRADWDRCATMGMQSFMDFWIWMAVQRLNVINPDEWTLKNFISVLLVMTKSEMEIQLTGMDEKLRLKRTVRTKWTSMVRNNRFNREVEYCLELPENPEDLQQMYPRLYESLGVYFWNEEAGGWDDWYPSPVPEAKVLEICASFKCRSSAGTATVPSARDQQLACTPQSSQSSEIGMLVSVLAPFLSSLTDTDLRRFRRQSHRSLEEEEETGCNITYGPGYRDPKDFNFNNKRSLKNLSLRTECHQSMMATEGDLSHKRSRLNFDRCRTEERNTSSPKFDTPQNDVPETPPWKSEKTLPPQTSEQMETLLPKGEPVIHEVHDDDDVPSDTAGHKDQTDAGNADGSQIAGLISSEMRASSVQLLHGLVNRDAKRKQEAKEAAELKKKQAAEARANSSTLTGRANDSVATAKGKTPSLTTPTSPSSKGQGVSKPKPKKVSPACKHALPISSSSLEEEQRSSAKAEKQPKAQNTMPGKFLVLVEGKVFARARVEHEASRNQFLVRTGEPKTPSKKFPYGACGVKKAVAERNAKAYRDKLKAGTAN